MNILISACLLGLPCRYDGQSKACDRVADLGQRHHLIPFCPECYGGLPTPRIPAEIREGRVYTKDGRDVTAAYYSGAAQALAMCRMFDCRAAVLKEKSPSCGHGKIYDGTFTGTLTDGDGITAALLEANGVPVYGESQIPALLEAADGIPFTKMHGIGNDYIYIDHMRGPIAADPAAAAKQMSARRFSVGADGVICICPPEQEENHGRMRMFNADGSEGKMCGNGLRCVGKFLYDHGYLPEDCTEVRIETAAGVKTLTLRLDGKRCTGATADMGKAVFASEQIPVRWAEEEMLCASLEANGSRYEVTAVSMGNPHAVLFTDAPARVPLEEIGPLLENHVRFPERTNVEFVQVVNRTHLRMRVWERGSGETLACGTGACAAVAAAIRCGFCDAQTPVTVELPGGKLTVTVSADWNVTLEGSAETVYEGLWLPDGN